MSDIEEFLRRAAERRARIKRPDIEILDVVDAEVIEAEPVDVSAHVASHLNTSGFDSRASQLGERVGQADDVLEAHLHAKFDHRLGNLRDQAVEAELVEIPSAVPGSTSATDLLQLLHSPQHLRQAIILSEILRPPTHRW